MNLSTVQKETTQEMELVFPGEEGGSLLVLLTITGTSLLQASSPPRSEVQVGSLNITVRRATGLPKLSGGRTGFIKSSQLFTS